MAPRLRPELVRQLLSTSVFSSRSAAAAPTSTVTTSTNADNKPVVAPSPTLFVSGLNKRTTSEKLQEAFSEFGEVVDARVMIDRATGFSRGFGFVRYASIEDADKGIKGMDGQFLDGWVIFAEYARTRTPPGQPASPKGYPTTR